LKKTTILHLQICGKLLSTDIIIPSGYIRVCIVMLLDRCVQCICLEQKLLI